MQLTAAVPNQSVPPVYNPDNIDFCGDAYVLIPCDEVSTGTGECDSSPEDTAAIPIITAVRAKSQQARPLPLWQRSKHFESSETGLRKKPVEEALSGDVA